MIVSTPKQENKIARSRDHRFYTFLKPLRDENFASFHYIYFGPWWLVF